MKLGDAIATVAQPIARGIDAVARTNVAGCSGCKKMRENLNQGMSVVDAIYERWFAAKQKGDKVKYQIILVVEKDKMGEAVQAAEAIGEVLSVQVRTTPQTVRNPVSVTPAR